MQRLFGEKSSLIGKRLSWKRLFSILLALSVFSFLGVRAIQGFQELSQSDIDFIPGYLVFSFLCQFFGVLLAAAVWNNILSRINIKTPYRFDLEVFSVSALARKIPGTVWYAIGRLAIYSFEGIEKAPVVIGLAIEAISLALGGAIAFSLSLGMGLISFEWLNAKIFWIATPGLIAIVSILGPKLIDFAIRRTQKRDPPAETKVLPKIRTSDVLVWLSGEAGVAAFAGGVAYFVLRSIIPDSSVPYAAVMGAFSMSMMIGPIAMWLPGDIGIKDGFMYLVLIAWMSSAQAAVIVLAWRIWLSLIEILIGLVAGISLSRKINIREVLIND